MELFDLLESSCIHTHMIYKSEILWHSWGIPCNQSLIQFQKNPIAQVNIRVQSSSIACLPPVTLNVTEFWKITLMGAPETIRVFVFTMMLLTSENLFQVFLQLFL